MIVYDNLWTVMEKERVSQYRLKLEGISNSSLMRLRRNEAVSTETINKLCRILHCDVPDIMKYLED